MLFDIFRLRQVSGPTVGPLFYLCSVQHTVVFMYTFSGMIFNHRMDGIYEDIDCLPGLELWSGTALSASQPSDIVQLHPGLRNDYERIVAHYDRCGLSVASNIVWDDDFRHLAAYPEHDISVTYFGDGVHRNRPDPFWLSSAALFNDKNEFLRHGLSMGVPFPRTVTFREGEDPTAHDLVYPVYLKAALSAAGLGVSRCENALELAREATACAGAFQVQEAVPLPAVFLNVQYQARDGRADFLATTEQILEGVSHIGNRWPVNGHPRAVTDRLADDLVRLGLKGVFAFDLAASGPPGDSDFRMLECNPRWNGASYLWFTARKLGAEAWTGLMLTCPDSFADSFDLGELEYRPLRGSGLVIVNWTRSRFGRTGVLAIGRPTEQDFLFDELAARDGWRVPDRPDREA